MDMNRLGKSRFPPAIVCQVLTFLIISMKNWKPGDEMFICSDSSSYFNTQDKNKGFSNVSKRLVYVCFGRSNGSCIYSNNLTGQFLVIYRASERMTSVPKTEDSVFNWPGFSHSPLQSLSWGFRSSM